MAWTAKRGDKSVKCITDDDDRAWVPARWVAEAFGVEIERDDGAASFTFVDATPVKPPKPTIVAPCEGPISREFGERPTNPDGTPYYTNPWKRHIGRDIAVPEGTRVVAVRDAVVEWAGEWDALGLCVVLWHSPDSTRTLYAHLSYLAVVVGEKLKAGWPVGRSGNTGKSDGAHLHHEVWLNCHGGPGDPYTLTRGDRTAEPADPAPIWRGEWPIEGVPRP